jgi:Leucine-rich repeat (LRR) protein
MCIICQTPDVSTLINLTKLECSQCPQLTSIPSTLINLTTLNCSECHLLTSIPSTLINLTYLNCLDCPVTSIPSTLINLIYLNCSYCILLTRIPSTLNKLKYFICTNSPWINKYKTKNITKLITIQQFVKKNIKGWIFSRWIKSREGVEWIYHPDNIGGKIAKKEIEKMFN